MNKILLDTNGYGAFKKNDPMATGVIRSVEYIGLSNDMWIAASTLRHGLSLFTLDEHFNNIDGLILKSKAL
jgi:predicted nucleic acid-binding protein